MLALEAVIDASCCTIQNLNCCCSGKNDGLVIGHFWGERKGKSFFTFAK